MKNIGQSGGASRWRVCYQWGLPYLVLTAAMTIASICTPQPDYMCYELGVAARSSECLSYSADV